MRISSKKWGFRPGGRFRALLLALVLTAIWVPGPAAAADQVLGVREKLPNDLVWLYSQQTGLPLVTLELIIKAGTLQDPKGKAGLANLTASLLLSGTKSRNATQIAQELDFMGARLKAGGGDDFASLSLLILKKDLGAGLELLQDVLLNPTFALPEVQRKVAQYQAALESEQDEPMVVAGRTFAKDLYGDFPYGHPVRGTPQGLAAITPKDLAEFHRTYYRPNNAVLSLVGDLTQDEARQAVSKTFGSWAAAPIPALKLPPIPALSQRKVVVIDKDISQANIILGSLGINRQNPDFYALQVMNYILGGGGFSSRLMDDIRENRGLAYSVSSSFQPGPGTRPLHRGPGDQEPQRRRSHHAGAGAAQAHHEPAGATQGTGRRQILLHRQLCPEDGFHEQAGLAPELCGGLWAGAGLSLEISGPDPASDPGGYPESGGKVSTPR